MGSSSSSSSEPLSEAELRALRGSKFAALPAPRPPSRAQPRLAHPAGPMTTNKAAALAKFLKRKLQQPGGLNSIDPDLLELAVKNAKETVNAGNAGPSNSGRIIRHVTSFGDSPSEDSGEDQEQTEKRKRKKNKKVAQGPEGLKTVKPKKKKKTKKKKSKT